MFWLLSLAASVKPIIGIPSTWTSDTTSVKKDYISSIFKAGGIPFVIPVTNSKEDVAEIISHVDAILVPGGHDVTPFLYNEEPLPELGEYVPKLDSFDYLIFDEAMKRDLPIMGVCRGHQILNVYNGGSLYQDIPKQFSSVDGKPRIQHRQASAKKESAHHVTIAQDSKLYELLGKTRMPVNTLHHQAVKDVAPTFKITATADDGLVEGIEMIDNPKVFGIQWHPEGPVDAGDDTYLPLFQYLVQEAAKVRAARTN